MPAPHSHTETTVTISVLDRLIDREPDRGVEEQLTRAQSVRLLKEGVRRDLEWLLNTRRIVIPPEESLRELNTSVYVYGLPDFTAMNMSSAKDQAKLLRSLQSVVKLFEPRLANVRILPIQTSEISIRMLRFRIEGLLRMDPAPEHISFDTVMDLTTDTYQVLGEANAR